jgi:type IV secretory pathway VirB10-like protein
MKNAIVYGLTAVAGVAMIWFVTSVLPIWVAAKQAASPAGAAHYREHLEALAIPSPAKPQKPVAPTQPLEIKSAAAILEASPAFKPLAEEKVEAKPVEKTPDELRTEEAIRGYHAKAAQMAKEREADEEKARREHEIEIRRLELEAAKARARAADGAPPVVVVMPSQPAPSPQISLREVEAMEQRNEELRLLRLQVALEMARLRGENVTIVDYGLGAEQRRRAASIARALNDPDPLRRAKTLRILGYEE